MFTGLIEAVGRVAEAKGVGGGGLRVCIRTELAPGLAAGDSLAVNGVCLTVIVAEGGEVHADVGPETARITTLGALRHEQALNLERPLKADGRVGGHFVQGHVDGMGTIDEIRTEGDARWFTVSYPPALAPLMVRKGSIAVDGVSLTLAGLGETKFDVMIVPFTWEHTSMRALRVGDRVNLECDIIGKYVARALELSETGRLKAAQTMK
ncbi:MAG: riboflavin synthase [Acidimicrobiia bacterium]|nr:riboflavin synthase [Acidimicrobiia bacterium]